MKILVIDGQGGKMGAALTDQIKKNMPDVEVVAVGTNSLATSAMLRAGADAAATRWWSTAATRISSWDPSALS